ncbi:MAG: hypothetical protein Ct9H300mP18_08220 [Candidatus Neomarinimicrobiota bacterium]|nr:MAG: hypothetical protein Ct9H300mP18_08220 [Candidatus Neomarinimicrobiota bacterium]
MIKSKIKEIKGDGEAGSPDSFYDLNDNTWYDGGKEYTTGLPLKR